jgi:hypothetical protein
LTARPSTAFYGAIGFGASNSRTSQPILSSLPLIHRKDELIAQGEGKSGGGRVWVKHGENVR